MVDGDMTHRVLIFSIPAIDQGRISLEGYMKPTRPTYGAAHEAPILTYIARNSLQILAGYIYKATRGNPLETQITLHARLDRHNSTRLWRLPESADD
jgi:hypothetical protein